MKLCAVCRTEVDEQEALRERRVVYYSSRFYYFMCPKCKWAFLKDPKGYVFGRGRPELCPASRPCPVREAGR